jgi:predicted PurR-regulated permease PerM
VHPTVDRLAAYSWRLLVIVGAALPIGWLIDRLWVVIFPIVLATFLTVPLAPISRGLRRRGVPPSVASWSALVALLGVLTLAGFAVVPALASEFDELGPTVGEGVDDLQQWIIDEEVFGLGERQVTQLREDAGDAVARWARSSSGVLVRRAIVALELVLGVLLSIVVAFFLLKDGERLQRLAMAQIPTARHDVARRMARAAWTTLGGYLRGSALLGVVEGTIIGIAMAIAGSGLVVPVMVLTLLAAFVPFVGAIVAGVVATLVTLVTAGPAEAAAVGIVAIVVQQLDNDLLAPVVFGRALALHPLVILFSITAGAALIGPVGAIIGVPTVAVVVNVLGEARSEPPPAPT